MARMRRFFERVPGVVRRFSLLRLQRGDADGESTEDEDDELESGAPRMRDRIRGWFKSSSSAPTPEEPPRMKAKFDGLFEGMPGLDDILDGGMEEEGQTAALSEPSSAAGKARRSMDDSTWFEQERRSILNNYEQILSDMLVNLEQQRKEDPEAVPANAEAMIKSVLKQEMDTEIEETKERLSRERLASYEAERRIEVEEKDVSGPVLDASVRRLIDEGEAEYERQLAAQLQVDEFLRYEEEAFRKATEEAASNKIKQPEKDADLDQWALERLKDMASRQEELAAEDVVLDILDENLEDLRERIEKETAKSSPQPETMKEWQMYRAIATRLGGKVDEGGSVVSSSNEEMVSDEEVFRRLQSWKEYNEKEDGIRAKGGLSRGPKLPFEWQELGEPEAGSKAGTREGRIETRKQINRMSIDALESLMQTSDAARREKLQKEIEYLKRELESKDYLDFEEPEETEAVQAGPVDLSDVFSSTADEQTTEQTTAKKPPINTELQAAIPPSIEKPSASAEPDIQSTATPLPPKTAFFEADESMEVAETDSKLGTMEDQKLEAMYRKAGARTREEQERIKAGYEEFKRVEEEKRKISGLDMDGDDDLSKTTLNYNVSEVMLEGGDFDAEKILSSIGPRPSRSKQSVETTSKEQIGEVEASSVTEEEVASSLYRSVSAAGGGRFKDDPDARAQDEASFSEYLQMEKEMREKVEETPTDQLGDSALPSGMDDEEYADKVISELGPRPSPKRDKKIDEQYLSDTGGAVEKREERNDLESSDITTDAADESDVPEWIKREQEGPPRRRFLRGEDIEEAFSDDEYEKNMRQLAEYERRRAGTPRQMGIDISDILGPRRDIDTDDYKDYKYDDDISRGQRVGWGGATYETRKRDLLDYTELDVPLLNALFEQRDAVSATGVSRYMAKINKPFKEFGAILRLEGVIIDVSGLNMKAWSATSEAYGLREPSLEEVKMASVVRPELAVTDIFGWTADIPEMRQITNRFREEFNKAFEEWAKDEGLLNNAAAAPAPTSQGSLAIGEEVVQEQGNAQTPSVELNENEVLGLLTQAWTRTADEFSFPRPTQDAIVSAASLQPDLAVLEVFGWTKDLRLVDQVASFQRKAVQVLREGKDVKDTGARSQNAAVKQVERVVDQNALMELHYRAWTAVASALGYDRPTSDEVLGAFVLNDPVLVAKSGFGWTENLDEAQKIAQAFTDKLRALLDEPAGSVYGGLGQSESTTDTKAAAESPRDSSPSFEDIVKIHTDAWAVTSHMHCLSSPTPEQTRLSVNMDPQEFIERIAKWSTDEDASRRIATTFQSSLQDATKSFIEAAGYAAPESVAPDLQRESPKSGPSSDELFETTLNAWKAVASKLTFPEPTSDQILYAMSVGPDEAVRFGFRWSRDEEKVAEILGVYRKELETRRSKWSSPEPEGLESTTETQPLVVANPGSAKWINSLLDVEMECGVVSHLTRPQVNTLLDYAGIAHLIEHDKRVVVSPNSAVHPTVKHYWDAQQMLAAALRLERRPDHCVVIDASPGGSTAASSVEMQSVAWIGSYPRYELLAADATVNSLDDLTAMNIRRLFGERIYDQPLLDMQQTEPDIKRKIKTVYDWGDDDF